MTAFLAWIYAQAAKVYAWFGVNFSSLYEGASHAWSWASDLANHAYANAINYAYGLYHTLQSLVTNTANYLQTLLNNALRGVSEDITALFDWVEWKISQVTSVSVEFVVDLVNSALRSIASLSTYVDGIFQGAIDYVLRWVNDNFGWVIDLRESVMGIVDVLTPENLRLMLEIIGRWINTIVTFFDNPLTFILDVIQERFVSFLCYILAWSLGTTIYDLPKTPPWKER